MNLAHRPGPPAPFRAHSRGHLLPGPVCTHTDLSESHLLVHFVWKTRTLSSEPSCSCGYALSIWKQPLRGEDLLLASCTSKTPQTHCKLRTLSGEETALRSHRPKYPFNLGMSLWGPQIVWLSGTQAGEQPSKSPRRVCVLLHGLQSQSFSNTMPGEEMTERNYTLTPSVTHAAGHITGSCPACPWTRQGGWWTCAQGPAGR